jgi:hypothetical protein
MLSRIDAPRASPHHAMRMLAERQILPDPIQKKEAHSVRLFKSLSENLFLLLQQDLLVVKLIRAIQ